MIVLLFFWVITRNDNFSIKINKSLDIDMMFSKHFFWITLKIVNLDSDEVIGAY